MPYFRNTFLYLICPAFLRILMCISTLCLVLPLKTTAREIQNAATLAPIVVTARASNHEYQTGDVNKSLTPVFYHEIRRTEFEGKSDNLAEVIEKQAGVQIRQSGGLGSFSSVSLRGASSEQVLIFMDGVLLNDASGGGVDLSNISLADVDSIEIYRGMTPIGFDSASIGGVVNIKSIRATPGLHSSATLGYGSFNTQQFAGLINHRPGKWDYLISADYLRSDNDFRISNDNGTPSNPSDDRRENRNNAQVDQFNVLSRLGFETSSDSRFDVINKFFSKKQGLPSWNNSEATDTEFVTRQNISTIKWLIDDVSSLHFDTCTQLDYLFKEEEYNDSNGHVGLGSQKNRYDTRRLSGKTYAEYRSDYNALQFTIAASGESYRAEDLINRQTTIKSDRFSMTVGFQDTVFLFNHRLQVTPGLRFQHIADNLEKAVDDKGHSIEPEDRNDNYLMPQIGVKYFVNQAISIKANMSQYHRIPSFYELFGDRGFFLGNPELKPEKGINADAGVEIHKTVNSLMLKRCSGYGVIFMSRMDDLISRTYDSRGIGKSDNISSADIFGVECNLTLELNQFVSVTAQYTWQDTENKSDIKAFSGNRLPGKFTHSWLMKAGIKYADVAMTIEYINEDDMYYDTANLLKAKAKSEVNASLSWVWKSILLTLEAKNIGNDNYEDFNGYPQPGRSYFCSVKYSM